MEKAGTKQVSPMREAFEKFVFGGRWPRFHFLKTNPCSILPVFSMKPRQRCGVFSMPFALFNQEDPNFSSILKLPERFLRDAFFYDGRSFNQVAVATFRPHSGRPPGGIRLVGPGAHSAGPSAHFVGNPAE
jgi:hypothetical protein